MYQDTLERLADVGRKKADMLRAAPLAFMVGSMLAGAYVGVGIILTLTVAGPMDPAWQKFVMGISFGVALTLVVFAGSELFTGHTLYMVLSWLRRLAAPVDVLWVWMISWVFNLAGSALLAALFTVGAGGAPFGEDVGLLHRIAEFKMNSPPAELFARAVLCNWLVCLALWTSARTGNDAAKLILIFWCLFAFFANGFDHSVANMTLLSLALFSDHPDTISIAGMAYNLFWVTLGNIVGGGLLVGMAYWWASNAKRPELAAGPDRAE